MVRYKMIFELISIFFCVFRISDCANILAYVPTPSFSHQVAFRDLWKELSLRGHKIILVTTDPLNDAELENLKEIDMGRSYEIWNEKHNFSENVQTHWQIWKLYEFFLNLAEDVVSDQLAQKELKDLIEGGDKYNFDLMMIEDGYFEMLAFTKIYKCPAILMSTIGSSLVYPFLGNVVHPVLNTDMNLPYVGELNFKERLISTIFHWYATFILPHSYLPMKQRIIDTYFGNTINVRIEDLIQDISFMLVNEIPLLKGIRAPGPNTIFVGGNIRSKPSNPITQVINIFVFE